MRWKTLALGALAVVAFALGVGAFWLGMWRRSGLPERSGEFTVPGLSAPVAVRLDERAVPHVRAEKLVDLAAALGWLHANDRLFQLEMGRRRASGRLAEVVGAGAVAEDVRMRELGLRRTAESYVAALTPESRELLDAYARGVNAWLDAHRGDLPSDLDLLVDEVAPWQPADSLCFALLMACDLCYPRFYEEQRFEWLGAFGKERALDLIGKGPLEIADDVLVLAADARKKLAAADPTLRSFDAGAEHVEKKGGSNNWAVDAERSEANAALVANDPHLGLGLPALWYEAGLRATDYDAYGMTLAGLPVVVIGRGPDVAWGFTNSELDATDEFLEELSADGTSVRRGDSFVPIEKRAETIRVKDGEDVVVDTGTTDRGVLLPSIASRGLPARSLAWTAYTPFDPVAPFVALARSKSVDDVPRAIADFVAPVQSIVAGDTRGAVLFTLLGRAPERARGDGSFPAPGWDARWAWNGLRAADDNPRISRPSEGFVATANNDTRPQNSALALAGDFANPSRIERIRERLDGARAWTPEKTLELQLDVVSRYALALVAALPNDLDGDARAAADLLRAWDGRMQKGGAAALFGIFERELGARVFDDEFRAAKLGPMGLLRKADALERLLVGELSAKWCDDVETPGIESLRDALVAALAAALKEMRTRFGAEPSAWDWTALNVWQPEHPLAAAPYIGGLFRRGPFMLPGSAQTVCVFTGWWRGDHVAVGHGASMRWIADLGDGDRSLTILPGGQSGHPFDAHFDDQLEDYVAGRMRRVYWSDTAIDAHVASTIALKP
ncbi:MAG: penicillin acylase family protein [Planctomycetes bacterium]|nr:penicillin acylase family protein [Planctomycetota bacterium]